MLRRRLAFFAVPCLLAASAIAASAQAPATRAVAVDGDPAPGGGTFVFSDTLVDTSRIPAIAGENIVFSAYVSRDGESLPALAAETNGELRLLARAGDALLGGTYQGETSYAPDRLGNVFATVRLHDAPDGDTIVKFSEDGPVRMLGVGDMTPLGPVTSFLATSVVPDGAGGAYARPIFRDDYHYASVLHLTAGGASEVIAASGQAAPGGGSFMVIYGPLASTADGRLLFGAQVGANDVAYFELADGRLTRLALNATQPTFTASYSIALDEQGAAVINDRSTGAIERVTQSGVDALLRAQDAVAPRIGVAAEIDSSISSLSVANDRVFLLTTYLYPGDGRYSALFRRDANETFDALLLGSDAGPARLGTVFASFALGTQNTTAHFANEDGDIVFAATTVALDNTAVSGVFTTLNAIDPEAPTVTSASVVDGKLVVTGEGFARGDRIVVGTRRFKNTKPDKASPTTTLTSKTADAALLPRAPTPISVIDKNGHQSAAIAVGPFD